MRRLASLTFASLLTTIANGCVVQSTQPPPPTGDTCTTSADCTAGAGGLCTTTSTGGYCAYTDSTCPSGYRYPSNADGYANMCAVFASSDTCSTSTDCTAVVGGLCTTTSTGGYCAYPDSTCPSGYRYPSNADAYSSMCVVFAPNPCTASTDCTAASGGLCTPADSTSAYCAYPDSSCTSGFRFAGDAGTYAGACVAVPQDVVGDCATITYQPGMTQAYTITYGTGGYWRVDFSCDSSVTSCQYTGRILAEAGAKIMSATGYDYVWNGTSYVQNTAPTLITDYNGTDEVDFNQSIAWNPSAAEYYSLTFQSTPGAYVEFDMGINGSYATSNILYVNASGSLVNPSSNPVVLYPMSP